MAIITYKIVCENNSDAQCRATLQGINMMEKPKTLCPESWASYNLETARILTERNGFGTVAELELEPYSINPEGMLPCIQDLTLAVRRAVSELHGTSAKADRIALQLITALALFSKENGT